MDQGGKLLVVLVLIFTIVIGVLGSGGDEKLGSTLFSEERNNKVRFGETPLNVQINDQIQQISKKCLINLRGVECPGNNNRRFSMENLLVAGLGYDRFSHDVQPQVLKSQPYQAFGSPQVNSHYSSMNTATEFYSLIYPANQNQVFYNGLYAHNGNADQMFTKFFSGDFNVANAQQQYITHTVNVEPSVTEDFARIIDLLPENYDESIYNMIITSFGDSVLTSVKYGGVVDSTVSVRSCFSDGNMANYVKTELSHIVGTPEGQVPLGYAQYHKVSQLDIAGGNAQEADIPRRISSFAQNPVPIIFESVPIWHIFPPGQKKENMKTAHYNYINSKTNIVNDMVNRLNYLRDLEALSPTPFVAYTKKGPIHTEWTRGQVSGDGQSNIGTLPYSYIGKKLAKTQGSATIRIFRHRDNTFHIQLDTRCDSTNNFPGFEPIIANSDVINNGCATIVLPQVAVKKIDGETVLGYSFDTNNVVVCHGCNPELKVIGITLECPVPPAKPCPIVQQVQ